MAAHWEWNVPRESSAARGAQQFIEPLPHLLGRLVGERQGHDAPGVDAHFLDQIGDAVGDDPRLAGTGPGEDQQRPLDVLGGFPLLGIEAGEEVLGWRGGHGGIISGRAGAYALVRKGTEIRRARSNGKD